MRIGSEWSFLRTFTRAFSTTWGQHKPHEKDLKKKLGNQKAKACFPPSFTSSAPYKALGDQETEDDEGGRVHCERPYGKSFKRSVDRGLWLKTTLQGTLLYFFPLNEYLMVEFFSVLTRRYGCTLMTKISL